MTMATLSHKEVQTLRQFASSQPGNGEFQESIRSAFWHETSAKGEGHSDSKDRENLMELVTILRTKAERADSTPNNTLYRGLPTNVLRAGNRSKKYETGCVHKWTSFVWVSKSLEGAKLTMGNKMTSKDSSEMEGTLFILRIPESIPKTSQGCWGYNVSRYTRRVAPFQGLFSHSSFLMLQQSLS